MDKKLENKIENAKYNLENALNRLQDVIDSVEYALNEIDGVEDAQELWDVLCDLGETVDNAQFAASDIEDAYNEADDELEEMTQEDEEEEEE